MGMRGLRWVIRMGGRLDAMGEEEATQLLDMIQKRTVTGGLPGWAPDGEPAGVRQEVTKGLGDRPAAAGQVG